MFRGRLSSSESKSEVTTLVSVCLFPGGEGGCEQGYTGLVFVGFFSGGVGELGQG